MHDFAQNTPKDNFYDSRVYDVVRIADFVIPANRVKN